MAGEFIPDAPNSRDAEAKKMLRKNKGSRGSAVTRAPKITKSNGSVARGGRRIASGAASVRGGAL
jgi:hypothetical protein